MMLSIAVALMVFVSLMAILDRYPALKAKVASILGASASEIQPPVAAPEPANLPYRTDPPHNQPSSGDHMCRLWLYEQQKPRFDADIATAEKARDEQLALFGVAMERPLSEDERRRLDAAQDLFINNLMTADDCYQNVFGVHKNMSLTDPYKPSSHPLEGMQRLPEIMHRTFRELHDRANSMEQLLDGMRDDFRMAINSTQGLISQAAHKAIERERENRY